MVVGILVSFWEGLFSGAMLNFGRVVFGACNLLPLGSAQLELQPKEVPTQEKIQRVKGVLQRLQPCILCTYLRRIATVCVVLEPLENESD